MINDTVDDASRFKNLMSYTFPAIYLHIHAQNVGSNNSSKSLPLRYIWIKRAQFVRPFACTACHISNMEDHILQELYSMHRWSLTWCVPVSQHYTRISVWRQLLIEVKISTLQLKITLKMLHKTKYAQGHEPNASCHHI